MKRSAAIALLALMISSAGTARPPGLPRSLLMESPSGDSIVFHYEAEAFPASIVQIDGRPYRRFAGEDRASGQPVLPSLSVTIGIPAGSTVIAQLVDAAYRTTANQLVAPAPRYTITDQSEAVAQYAIDDAAYSGNRFFPGDEILVGSPYELRGQQCCTIRLFPLQYNPSSRTLRTLVNARLVVTIVGLSPEKKESVPVRENSHSERLLRNLLVNYNEARAWRAAPPVVLSDPSGDWFQTGHNYVRIPVARDGWYSVSPLQLAALGIVNADPATFQMFAQGVEIPLEVDSSIGFYGRRHRGDSTDIDFYTDTSAYWLTWGVSQGKRFLDTPGPGGVGTKINTFPDTIHAEQNTDYYEGTGDLEIIQNGDVAGEGWVWDYFYPNTVKSYQCVLDGVDTTSVLRAALRVRLFSTTLDYASVDHHAKFWVNDSLAGELFFEGRTQGLFSTEVPASWLRNGTNQVRIQSLPTPSSPNQFYLDWFEVGYPRTFRATGNQLSFRLPAASSPVRMTLRGFTDPAITIMDLTTGRNITGGAVTGDSISGFSVTVVDTMPSGAHSYYAWAPSASLPVSGMRVKQFVGLRANTTGADYVIIAHENFLPAAQQLAAHRQSFNGVRTAVVNVQDIYDEFNYGVLSAVPIKTFLRSAMQQWPGPAPSSLLLFGDACWDFHHYMSSTTKVNYVPAYGVPAGDNWFASFDTTAPFIPSMDVGRIPASDEVQAQRTVAKIIVYDNVGSGDWIKRFLFITGGGATEQPGFKSLSESLISGYVVPAPVGGTPIRVFKSSVGVIDGENKILLRSLVKDGLVFMNFLGHSGGAVWDVSIGDPNELENTNGLLPFVCSVSCNVGAFAEPSRSVLSEEFVMADNRGACAMWASSSLGYANLGTTLVEKFLEALSADSLRDLGALTTLARIRLWQEAPQSIQRIAMANLNPLIGDPLTRLALPLQPDLVITPQDIAIKEAVPTPLDSVLSLSVKIRNWGLVPSDSVTLSVTDLYNGNGATIANAITRAPTASVDSFTVSWDASYQTGKHTVTVSLDPGGRIAEADETNNVAAHETYVYANTLSVVSPIHNMVVAPGIQTLVVTSPIGRDSAGFRYYFELDTVETFDSPVRDSSGAVIPGVVSGEWQTPSLGQGGVYFWRARTSEAGVLGNWVTSCIVVDSVRPAGPEIRLREKTARQFNVSPRVQTTATDSGTTIQPSSPVQITARSLGYRADANMEYYSIIRVNEQVITGYWWAVGSSFMTVRMDDFSGAYEYRPFDVVNQAVQADSMAAFLRFTPTGNYVAITVVFDGKTNVSESLYVMLESLGSTMIRSVQPGQSWAFIGRKGSPAAALESLTSDSAVVSLQIPNVYRFGSGTISMPEMAVPFHWDHLHWIWSGPPGTGVGVMITGTKPGGMNDTLGVLPVLPADVDLSFLDSLTAQGKYATAQIHALLTSSDPLVTPVLKEWWVDIVPEGDLAVSARSVGPPAPPALQQGDAFTFPVDVYNIGFRNIDSGTVAVALYDRYNKARTIATTGIGAIAPGGMTQASIPLNTGDFPRHVTLQVSASPAGGRTDLVAANNIAYYSFDVVPGVSPLLQVYADGIRVMDGDYISPHPKLLIRPDDNPGNGQRTVELSIEGVGQLPSRPPDDPFKPELVDGNHLLHFTVLDRSALGTVDTLRADLSVNVISGLRILHPLNYPNPFRTETYFTFVITGGEIPEELRIAIYTVTGRKIRDIVIPPSGLQIGFNKVFWDGRDGDGDELANGYYFYKILAKGSGKTESFIERMAKVM